MEISTVCRMFAHRALQPLGAATPLWEGHNSLARQSQRDSRGEAHNDGWGLAWYEAGAPLVTKSVGAVESDPRFGEIAREVRSPVLIAHVRQASVGSVSDANTHPFRYGRWTFAHNGTLEGFAAARERLLAATPADLRAEIRGQTDSEHAFYYWLGLLRKRVGDLDRAPSVDDLTQSLGEATNTIHDWFPPNGATETKLNFIATDGRLLAAVRWRHTLYRLDHPRQAAYDDKPAAGPEIEAVLVASEPTMDGDWREMPDKSVMVVDERLNIHVTSLAATPG